MTDTISNNNTASIQSSNAATEAIAGRGEHGDEGVYEFELLEAEKQRQSRIARYIMVIFMFIGLILGIANGYYTQVYISTANNAKIAEKAVCTFCFSAQNLRRLATVLKQDGQFTLPDTSVTVKAPKCVELSKGGTVKYNISYKVSIEINSIKIFASRDIGVNQISLNGKTVRPVKTTEGNVDVFNIIYPKKIKTITIDIFVRPIKVGEHVILPIIIYPNDTVQPLQSTKIVVQESCVKPPEPTTVPVTDTPVPTTTTGVNQAGKGEITPTVQATPPETGIVEDAIFFILGIFVGGIILKLVKRDFWADAFIDLVGKVYGTANKLIIKTLDKRTQTEVRILSKVIKGDSIEDSRDSSNTSSPR